MIYNPDFIFSNMDEGQDLGGKRVALLFTQPSTRTYLSFYQAILDLEGTPIPLPPATSMDKGETLYHTFSVLEHMGIDAVVYRGDETGVFPEDFRIPIINAGFNRQHPSQALIDLYTAEQAFPGKLLRVYLDGDVHSRVATSIVDLFRARGHYVYINYGGAPVPGFTFNNPYDIVMMFREQDGSPARRTLRSIPDQSLLMAPGPVMDEISPDLLSHERSLIWKQIQNGVPIRRGILRHHFQNAPSWDRAYANLNGG